MFKDRSAKAVILVTLVLILGTGVASVISHGRRESVSLPPEMRAVIERSCRDSSGTLAIGYNYYLLKKMGREMGTSVNVEIWPSEMMCADSVSAGSVDILVLPDKASRRHDSLAFTRPVDSLYVWAMSRHRKAEVEVLGKWLKDYGDSEEHDSVSTLFRRRLVPYKSPVTTALSPYDSLCRVWADSIGWDWRMLAAIIYKESRFHIEAGSARGARGLMQLMPHTARAMGVENPIDPEESIRAGAKLLGTLSERYSPIAENRTELCKFTLAAYNAGGGRIRDCIAYCRQQGVEPTRWDDIVAVLPAMADSSIIDNPEVRLGVFKGRETASYVNTVLSLYNRFKTICPEQ